MKWVNFFRSKPEKSKYYAIFEETYNKVLKQLRRSKIVENTELELLPFLFVLSHYASISAGKDAEVVLREIRSNINGVILERLLNHKEMIENRIDLYSEVILGKPIRFEWKHLFTKETLSMENATPRLVNALVNILTNPACAEDYDNAPFLVNDVFEVLTLSTIMLQVNSDIVEFFGKIYTA